MQRNVSVRDDKTHTSAPSTPPFTDRSCFIDSSVVCQHLVRGNHAHQPHHVTVLLLERDTINLPTAFSWPSERRKNCSPHLVAERRHWVERRAVNDDISRVRRLLQQLSGILDAKITLHNEHRLLSAVLSQYALIFRFLGKLSLEGARTRRSPSHKTVVLRHQPCNRSRRCGRRLTR